MFYNLGHTAAADHHRMLRIENARDLEGLGLLRRGRPGEYSNHDESKNRA